LRPIVYYLEMLVNPRLQNETGVYSREASIREYAAIGNPTSWHTCSERFRDFWNASTSK
jgi:hypothetical protein